MFTQLAIAWNEKIRRKSSCYLLLPSGRGQEIRDCIIPTGAEGDSRSGTARLRRAHQSRFAGNGTRAARGGSPRYSQRAPMFHRGSENHTRRSENAQAYRLGHHTRRAVRSASTHPCRPVEMDSTTDTQTTDTQVTSGNLPRLLSLSHLAPHGKRNTALSRRSGRLRTATSVTTG
jgi:hypothetical protein